MNPSLPRQLLVRILDEPNLALQIPALPPPVLAKLIDRIGLEDSGELIAFATTEQLAQVFDEDLWHSERAGEDEKFDAARFRLWLEVMLEAGDAFVAQKLAELEPDLVTFAFHRHVLVLDLESRMTASLSKEEANAIDKALSSCLSEEIDEFLIVSRAPDGWDTILAALLALDRDHHDLLVGILERCCAMSTEHIEDAGSLYEVLMSEEMLEDDLAGEREDRRAEAGYVAPSAAAAFLKLAREPNAKSGTARDPLTRAWFRGLGKATSAAAPRATRPAAPELLAVLRESEIVANAPMALLPSAESAATQEPLLIRAMRVLAEEQDDAFAARSEELAYLTNVLVAARQLRPLDAMRLAIDTTSRGLEMQLAPRPKDVLPAAVRALRAHPADVLFRAAWPTMD